MSKYFCFKEVRYCLCRTRLSKGSCCQGVGVKLHYLISDLIGYKILRKEFIKEGLFPPDFKYPEEIMDPLSPKFYELSLSPYYLDVYRKSVGKIIRKERRTRWQENEC